MHYPAENLRTIPSAHTTPAAEISIACEHLNSQLAADIQPQSLVIGGEAVQGHIAHTYRVRPTASAHVALEHWSTDSRLVVRLAKEITTQKKIGLLARQVLDSGTFIPGVQARRTAQIGRTAHGAAHMTIDVFRAPSVMTDEAFRSMRAEAQQLRHVGNTSLMRSLQVHYSDGNWLSDLGHFSGLTQTRDLLCNSVLPIVDHGQRLQPSTPQHLISVV